MPKSGKFEIWQDNDKPDHSVAVSKFDDGTAIISTQRIGQFTFPPTVTLTAEQVQELIRHLSLVPTEADDKV